MSVNEAPSFSSIPDVIEGSEVWVRGPMSKLPPLSDPVPSDWVVVEGKNFNQIIIIIRRSMCILYYFIVRFIFSNVIITNYYFCISI